MIPVKIINPVIDTISETASVLRKIFDGVICCIFFTFFFYIKMEDPLGLEPSTYGLKDRRSNQLS